MNWPDLSLWGSRRSTYGGFCLQGTKLQRSLEAPEFLRPTSVASLMLKESSSTFTRGQSDNGADFHRTSPMDKSKREAHGKVVRLVLASQVA
jgi:hypothetical protein